MQTTQSKAGEHMRIIGPNVNGGFFIADDRNNVWDGRNWRGFGAAGSYPTFRRAWIARMAAASKWKPSFR